MVLGYFDYLSKEIAALYKYRMVIISFITSTLKMRYKRSIVGFAWSFLGPLMNYCIIGFVLLKLARFDQPNYLSYILFGSLTFNFINVSMSLGGSSFINNEHYLKKIYLPKSTFVLSSIGMEFVNFLLGVLASFFVILFLGQITISWSLLFLPLSFFILFILSVSLGLILSISFVYFRDLMHVMPIFMQAVFYATPIVYPYSAVPQQYQYLLQFNPFFAAVEIVRYPLSYAEFPPLHLVINIVTITVLLFLVSVAALRYFENKIIFKL